MLISSRPSSALTTSTCRLPSFCSTRAIGSTQRLAYTPSNWFGALAGLLNGPSRLNKVRTPISLRGPAACFIAPWWRWANKKPTPTWATQACTCSGVRFKFTPAASSTSALPQALDTDRLPCLATCPPAAATTNAAVVEMLNVCAPSPPVPQVSMTCAPATSTFAAISRITSAAAATSSTVSPLALSAMRNAPICAGVAPPVMIVRMILCMSRGLRSWPASRVSRARGMFIIISTRRRGRRGWRDSPIRFESLDGGLNPSFP